MESNKDEALRCIELAVQFHKEGKVEQALKFVKKSINLYPTPEANALLNRLESGQHTTPTSSTTQQNNNNNNINKSTPAVSQNTTSPPPATQKTYTPEQHDAVVRIKKCSKDYYAVLEITREQATEVVIKKQYRKLALLMHPDKNSAPGAEEAFKVVSQAFATLSDPEKKKRYDLYGHDSVASAPSSGGGFRRQGGVYEHEISPEELFEMMFGLRTTGGSGFRTYSYQSGPRQRSRGGNGNQAADSGFSIFQLLPLLLLLFSVLIMSALNSGSDEPQFLFKKMAPYTVERITNRKHVSYFVNADIEEKIVNSVVNLSDLENAVEQQWRLDLERRCMFERQQKQRMERAANYYTDGQQTYMKERAQAFKMEACEALYGH